MGKLATVDRTFEDYLGTYTAMDAAKLRVEFARMMQVAAEHLLAISALVQTADDNGIDLGVPAGMLYPFRQIARKRLHPAAYTKFLGTTDLLNKVQALPLAEQKRLADGGAVPVYSFTNGKPEKREVPPHELVGVERGQVFGPNGIRSVAEQRSWLEARQKANHVRVQGEVLCDKKSHQIIVRVGNSEVAISLNEMLDYIKELT